MRAGSRQTPAASARPQSVMFMSLMARLFTRWIGRSQMEGTWHAWIRSAGLYTATQHTAQHILSGIAAAQFGLETVGVHIGLESCTVDFDKKVEWEVAEQIERRALDVVTLDIPVETTFNDQDAQARSRLGQMEADVIRVVRIGDFDKSACCGAHVASTGRIGVIRIFDLEAKKQGTRASFLAGAKALERSQAETAILRELRRLAGCATTDLPATFQKGLERSKELGKEVERIWSLRLGDLVKSAEAVTVGSSPVGVYVGELPRELAAVLAGMIAEATSGAGVVVSDTNIAISSRTLDAGGLLKKIQSRCRRQRRRVAQVGQRQTQPSCDAERARGYPGERITAGGDGGNDASRGASWFRDHLPTGCSRQPSFRGHERVALRRRTHVPR